MMHDLPVWLIYGAALLGPFVQEDAAILGASTASMTMGVNAPGVFVAALLGLLLSDVWKYWAGRLALRSKTASTWIANPRVQAAREHVVNRLGVGLLVARFVPGTRVPLYLACGVFKAPFERFLVYLALSGLLYVGLAFALVRGLGDVIGGHPALLAPSIGLTIAGLALAHAWLKRRRATPGI